MINPPFRLIISFQDHRKRESRDEDQTVWFPNNESHNKIFAPVIFFVMANSEM